MDTPNEKVYEMNIHHQIEKTEKDVTFLFFCAENATHLVNYEIDLIQDNFPRLKAYIIQSQIRPSCNMTLKKSLKRENFKALSQVVCIGIYYCEVEVLPENVFYDATKIEFLALDFNNIKELPSKLLLKAVKLVRFKASNNQIESISANFFKNLKRLTIVELDNNKLKRISAYSGLLTNNLNEFDLQHNICIDDKFPSNKPNGMRISFFMDDVKKLCH